MSARADVVRQIALLVVGAGDERLLVGVDGVDGVGKSTFADDLAGAVRAGGRPVVQVRLDDFLRPSVQRHARGRHSPDGFYLDSVDVPRFVDEVVRPVRAGSGGVTIRPGVFDRHRDVPLEVPPVEIQPGSVVLVDGIFLHRPELAAVWDVSVFLDAPFERSVARMAARDGGSPEVEAPGNRRYVEGQRRYLAECDPRRLATVVVDLTDVDAPRVVPARATRDPSL